MLLSLLNLVPPDILLQGLLITVIKALQGRCCGQREVTADCHPSHVAFELLVMRLSIAAVFVIYSDVFYYQASYNFPLVRYRSLGVSPPLPSSSLPPSLPVASINKI